MQRGARSLLVAGLSALLACASGAPNPRRLLDELDRASARCRALIQAVALARGGPERIESAPIESTCAPVWELRDALADGFEPPIEYALLLTAYVNLSVLYDGPDRERLERTQLRALRIAEDVRSEPALRSGLYARLAGFYLDDRPDEHQRLFLKAFRLAEQSGDLAVLAERHRELAAVRKQQGRLAEAEELSRKDVALLEERLAQIDAADDVENSRILGSTREAIELRRSLARRSAESKLRSASALLREIERCQRYAGSFDPERAASCCSGGELYLALQPERCALPDDPPLPTPRGVKPSRRTGSPSGTAR